jgi:hypothetical protein
MRAEYETQPQAQSNSIVANKKSGCGAAGFFVLDADG